MDIISFFLVFAALIVGLFVGLIRAGIKFDKERRAQNNQDLADRIRAGR